jgi:hypothetical protein
MYVPLGGLIAVPVWVAKDKMLLPTPTTITTSITAVIIKSKYKMIII